MCGKWQETCNGLKLAETWLTLAFNQWVAGSSPARLIYKYKEVNYLWAVSNGRPIHFATILLGSVRETTKVAYLLSYEDPNSFYRAIRTWEGTTPAHWRSVQQARPNDPMRH
jgi:AraC-like DNA-binding protein